MTFSAYRHAASWGDRPGLDPLESLEFRRDSPRDYIPQRPAGRPGELGDVGSRGSSTRIRNRGRSVGGRLNPLVLPRKRGRQVMTRGTMGTFARRAISKATRPKGWTPRSGERVPSGKMMTRRPAARRAAAASTISATRRGSWPAPANCRPAGRAAGPRSYGRGRLHRIDEVRVRREERADVHQCGVVCHHYAGPDGICAAWSAGSKSTSRAQRRKACIERKAVETIPRSRRARRSGSRVGRLPQSPKIAYPTGLAAKYAPTQRATPRRRTLRRRRRARRLEGASAISVSIVSALLGVWPGVAAGWHDVLSVPPRPLRT
jgi:hypothetical protein